MLTNLKNEMNSKRLSNKDLADFLGVSDKTIGNKINGESDLTFPEAIKIHKFIFPQFTMEYLFENQSTTQNLEN